MLYSSINPATEEKFAEYNHPEDNKLETILSAGHARFQGWKETPLSHRAELLERLAGRVEEATPHLAELLTKEVGKPLAQSVAELSRVSSVARYFAEHAAGILKEQPIAEVTEKRALIHHDPIGMVFAITPWNYPASLLARAALPALIAGNSVLLKPAPNVPGISLELERLFLEAGFPEGVFQIALLSNGQAARVIEDARVRMVSFTGSVSAGREIGRLAGGALKKAALELGGNDSFIVREDADAALAARAAVTARTNNAGQICCAPKRFLVHRSIIDNFTEEAANFVSSLKVADPLANGTQMGPLARRDLLENLRLQVDSLTKAGAVDCARSTVSTDRGFFYPATILKLNETVPQLNCQELFGPVLSILPFDDDRQAISIANATPFGLAASIFSKDLDAAVQMASRLECGTVCINSGVAVDPRIPFGGVKDSGFGRTYGQEGLLENTSTKVVVLPKAAPST